MKLNFKNLTNFDIARKSNFLYLADLSGLFASGLCFLHCAMLPMLLIFLPGLLTHNEIVHPILCGLAILSTTPMLFNKTFRVQSGFFQIALALGNMMMLLILFAHDYLPFRGELALSTIGGFSLIFVHYVNLSKKHSASG